MDNSAQSHEINCLILFAGKTFSSQLVKQLGYSFALSFYNRFKFSACMVKWFHTCCTPINTPVTAPNPASPDSEAATRPLSLQSFWLKKDEADIPGSAHAWHCAANYPEP